MVGKIKPLARINVTQSLMPDREKFHAYVDQILDSGWLTNNGQCVCELEKKLQDYLGVRNVVLVNNGTLALQVAYQALKLEGEVITSPFTFIATASSAKWEGLDVVFADIDPRTLNLDPVAVEQKITANTTAIVPVHVFGNPCDVEAFEVLAKKHGLKLIYDAAHAFGVQRRGESVLNWGDISILSFHSTKLFHTIEGGALIINDDDLCQKVRHMINFGITDPESIKMLGVNAKMNEFQAAMGLCLLEEIDAAVANRSELASTYDAILGGYIQTQSWEVGASCTHGYYPVLFEDTEVLKKVQSALNGEDIYPRRYFYPTLDTLDFLSQSEIMPFSSDVASRILCLPLYADLELDNCRIIAEIIIETLEVKKCV